MKKYIRAVCVALALLCAVFCVACGNDIEGCKEDYDSDNFYIKYNNVAIKLGDKADAVIAALGEAQSRTEIGDCGGLGAQVKYTYSSIDLYVLESKTDGNIIDQITFRDDIVSTPEGVCLGVSVADAKAYDSFQFLRNGYFCVDCKDSTPEHLVFNRIVSMKSSYKPQ